MPVLQAYNSKINAWVKYDFVKGKGFRVLDVKQREPNIPFVNTKIGGKRK